MNVEFEFHEIISYGIIILSVIFAIIKRPNTTQKSKNNTEKPVINGKTIEIKSIKLPFFDSSDDSLSSEFNGKSSKEDNNPFEV